MAELETKFESALGVFELHRYPDNKKAELRAWDAADDYLLFHLDEQAVLKENTKVLILNDGSGALSLALSQFRPVVITDSYLSTQAITQNALRNEVDENQISVINSLQSPDVASDSKFDIVLIKLPRTLAMLEDQLHRIRPRINESTKVIAAGMTKNIHMSSMSLFEKIIGPTKTSLARKKARLIFSEFDKDLIPAENPYPHSFTLPYELDGVAINLLNHSAVFSQEKLDIGTRFFIENLPVDEKYTSIVDLGCGNGALGLIAAIKNPAARLIFCDESYMAVESAIANFMAIFEESREAEFLQTDCLQGIDENSISLILCNPPFHQNNAINDYVAWQMFSESKQALQSKGELWVIGNRHLGYHAKLKKLFGNAEVVTSNKKFTILKAVK